jgi:hypothetical protein
LKRSSVRDATPGNISKFEHLGSQVQFQKKILPSELVAEVRSPDQIEPGTPPTPLSLIANKSTQWAKKITGGSGSNLAKGEICYDGHNSSPPQWREQLASSQCTH